MHQYKYLGSIINDNNSIEEEIKERIVLGTKAYYANLKFFKSKLVSKYKSVQISNKTNSDLCLRNVGIKRIFDPETVDIQKENPAEDIWSHERKPVMEY